MKRFICFFMLLYASLAAAAGPQPCYFSGQYVKCFPTLGLMVPAITWTDTTLGIAGTATNNNAATGYVGEYKENNQAGNLNYAGNIANTSSVDATASISGGTTTGETGIVLTAGDWDIDGHIFCSAVTAVSFTGFQGWIGTAAGNSTSGRDVTSNYTGIASTTTNDTVINTPTFRTSISGSTTYYLKVSFSAASATTINCRGSIRARRVR